MYVSTWDESQTQYVEVKNVLRSLRMLRADSFYMPFLKIQTIVIEKR